MNEKELKALIAVNEAERLRVMIKWLTEAIDELKEQIKIFEELKWRLQKELAEMDL